jgi:hypothetical protein
LEGADSTFCIGGTGAGTTTLSSNPPERDGPTDESTRAPLDDAAPEGGSEAVLAAAEVFDGGDGSDFDAVLASTDGPAAAAPAEDPPEGGGAAAVKEEEEEAGIEEEEAGIEEEEAGIGGGDLLSAALADGAEEALLVPSLVFVESVGLAAAAISLGPAALVSTLSL